MRLTLGLPVDPCPHCGGRMKLRALVRDRESLERFRRHQNLWTEPLGLAEVRPSPYFRSVTRLRPGPQVELFDFAKAGLRGGAKRGGWVGWGGPEGRRGLAGTPGHLK